jgi:hypothetical protein
VSDFAAAIFYPIKVCAVSLLSYQVGEQPKPDALAG